MAAAGLTREQAEAERLRVRADYLRVLKDYDRSQDRTKELRAIAAHDCELTALLEGNGEARALMQMRTLQISMLLVREPSAGNTSVFEQMLQSARSRTTSSVDTACAPVVLTENPPSVSTPSTAPAPAPTPAQATLLSIVPRQRIPHRPVEDHNRQALIKILTDFAESGHKPPAPIPAVVLDACRKLLAAGMSASEVSRFTGMSRMTLHRHGLKAGPL